MVNLHKLVEAIPIIMKLSGTEVLSQQRLEAHSRQFLSNKDKNEDSTTAMIKYIAKFSKIYKRDQKKEIIQAAALMAIIDGKLEDSEAELVVQLSRAIGMTDEDAEKIVKSTISTLSEHPQVDLNILDYLNKINR